jgi:hypothetical protein
MGTEAIMLRLMKLYTVEISGQLHALDTLPSNRKPSVSHWRLDEHQN